MYSIYIINCYNNYCLSVMTQILLIEESIAGPSQIHLFTLITKFWERSIGNYIRKLIITIIILIRIIILSKLKLFFTKNQGMGYTGEVR